MSNDQIQRQEQPKEPWGCRPSQYANEIILHDADGHWIAALQFNGELLPEIQESIADRMTDCINSFSGIRSEWIKKYGQSIHANLAMDVQDVSAKLDMVTIQRDKLVKLLEYIASNEASERISIYDSAIYADCWSDVDFLTWRSYVQKTLSEVKASYLHFCDSCGKQVAGSDECFCPECKSKAKT